MSRRLVVALSLACVRLGASLRVLRAQRRVLLRSSSVEDAEPAAVATESSRQRLQLACVLFGGFELGGYKCSTQSYPRTKKRRVSVYLSATRVVFFA